MEVNEERVESLSTANAGDFIETLRLLDRLQEKSSRDKLQTLRRAACEALVSDIIKPTFGDHRRSTPTCSVLLRRFNDSNLPLKLLLNHGLPGDFDSLEQWALAAPCDVIPLFEGFLSQKITLTLENSNRKQVRLLLGTTKRFH
jgi:hypothetical protein